MEIQAPSKSTPHSFSSPQWTCVWGTFSPRNLWGNLSNCVSFPGGWEIFNFVKEIIFHREIQNDCQSPTTKRRSLCKHRLNFNLHLVRILFNFRPKPNSLSKFSHGRSQQRATNIGIESSSTENEMVPHKLSLCREGVSPKSGIFKFIYLFHGELKWTKPLAFCHWLLKSFVVRIIRELCTWCT